jgi:hypothetical protein
MRLQETIAELGIVDAVAEITGIAAGSPLNEQIKKAYDAISSLSNR